MTTSQIVTITFICIALVIAIAVVAYLVKTQNYKMLSQIALKLVAEAEEKFAIEGQKTGDTKFGWVAKQLLNYMPPLVKAFIPASALEDIIETAVNILKEQLEKATGTGIAESDSKSETDNTAAL
jgi:hypothetical protein